MTKNKSKPIALLLAGLLWVSFAQAQDSANASGGDATGSGGAVAYSIGQVVYTSITGSSGSVDQGVQHAYEIFTVEIKETVLNISLTAFPNPTTDNLTLQISNYNNEKLSFQLYDMQGKLL
ncbi:MAG: T9SS type A sorting domain-containing protein, partial [Chitinophagaceae bacterium]|nr:T9SS type A sorting domain-containing protein [Chitinophagaceae bacterium]